MARKRHTPQQVILLLRQADNDLGAGASLAQVLQKLGVSENTYYRWRNQFGGMKADEAKRLKELETQGIVERRAYAEVPVRVEYRLTPKGLRMGDLFLPIIAHLRITENRAPGKGKPSP